MINITLHAIERYLDRINPTVTFKQARSLILDAMSRARRIKERSRMGDAYYVTEELRLVVAEERGNLTVISVLKLHEPEEEPLIPTIALELAKEFDEDRLTKPRSSRMDKEDNRIKEINNLRTALEKCKKENERLREVISKLKSHTPA